MFLRKQIVLTLLASFVAAITQSVCLAQEDTSPEPNESETSKSKSLTQLQPDVPVWTDKARGMVIMEGEVCLTRGSLEMFACLEGTKEHESIIAIPTDAFIVHAGLLSIGAEQGSPVQFDPDYVPPSGDVIDVIVQWNDETGKRHTRRAQDWIRDARSGEMMKYDFVFPGSYFWQDKPLPLPGEEAVEPEGPVRNIYAAEGGELICVSNFRSSTIDVPVPSSQENNQLWFKAYTENLPPEGTKVRVFLIPNKEARKGKNAKPPEDTASDVEDERQQAD